MERRYFAALLVVFNSLLLFLVDSLLVVFGSKFIHFELRMVRKDLVHSSELWGAQPPFLCSKKKFNLRKKFSKKPKIQLKKSLWINLDSS